MSHLSPATLVLKRSTFLSTGQKNTLSLSVNSLRLWAHHQALVPGSSPAKCGRSHSYTSQSFWEERAATSRTHTKGLESEYRHWGICAYTFSYVWVLDITQQDSNPAIFLPEFPKCWGMTSMCNYVQLVSFMWVWHITLCAFAHVCMLGGQRLILHIFFNCSSHYLSHHLSVNLKFTI